MKKLLILLSTTLLFSSACNNPSTPPNNSPLTVEVLFDRTKFSKQEDIKVMLRKNIVQNNVYSFEVLEEVTIAKDGNDSNTSVKTSKLVSGEKYTVQLSGKSSDGCNSTGVESKQFGITDFVNGKIQLKMENYQSTLLGCPPIGTNIPI